MISQEELAVVRVGNHTWEKYYDDDKYRQWVTRIYDSAPNREYYANPMECEMLDTIAEKEERIKALLECVKEGVENTGADDHPIWRERARKCLKEIGETDGNSIQTA